MNCFFQFIYDFSNELPKESVLLSDDMAFHLNFDSILKKGNGVLNVIRTDGEKTSIAVPQGNIDLSEEFSIGKEYKHAYWELSYWEEFPNKLIDYINQFEEVVTNRLHIGIAAALLHKRTTIYPNNYFKNKGIYELSLQSMPHVSFVE